MRSMLIRVGVVVGLLVAGSGWWYALRGRSSSVLANLEAKAAERPKAVQFGTDGAYCTAAVPKEWGVYRTGSQQSGLSFEAADGTLRFITNLPCDGSLPTIALQIRRTTRPANQ